MVTRIVDDISIIFKDINKNVIDVTYHFPKLEQLGKDSINSNRIGVIDFETCTTEDKEKGTQRVYAGG